MSIVTDYEFAIASGEFAHITPALRYVAAINPQASRREFIDALATIGLHPNTTAKQFARSRRFDLTAYGTATDAAGRILFTH